MDGWGEEQGEGEEEGEKESERERESERESGSEQGGRCAAGRAGHAERWREERHGRVRGFYAGWWWCLFQVRGGGKRRSAKHGLESPWHLGDLALFPGLDDLADGFFE